MKKKFLSMAVACSMLAAVGSSALTANAIEIEEETSQAVVLEEAVGAAVDEEIIGAVLDEEPAEAAAETENSSDSVYQGTLSYKIENDSTVTITKYNGEYVSYTIPSKIEGKPVRKIGSEAFKSSDLESVVIPYGVTSIQKSAFSMCKKLKNISIPESVAEIGTQAFSYCRSLEKINIPGKVAIINQFTFSNCSSLRNADIGNGITEIGSYAFNDCTALTNIVIPSSVKKLGGTAFLNCTSLKEVTLSEGLENIGVGTFRNCTSLRSISIPKTVTAIPLLAFDGCTNLRGIAVNDSTSYGKSDSVFSNCPKLTIYGNKGSHSETYANKYNIPFKPLSKFESDMNSGKTGDIDDDGKVTSLDALLVLRYSVGIEYFTEREKNLANVDGDKKITSADSLSILRYSVGIKDKDTEFYK